MPVTEDTVNDLMAQYLREQGLNVLTQQTIPFSGPRKPDFGLRDGGLFYGEGEWESKKWEGLAQARDYSEAIGAAGAFLLSYPDEIKGSIAQRRLEKVEPQDILSSFTYSGAFIRIGSPTDLRKTLDLKDIPRWLRERIHELAPAIQDPDDIVSILRQAVQALSQELASAGVSPDLFRNLLSADPTGKKARNAARDAAAYLLLDQIAFYRVLSYHRGYPEIKPDGIKHPSDLQEYFNKVLDQDYYPVFSYEVSKRFEPSSLPIIRKTIMAIYSLSPEVIGEGILRKVFRELIPLDVRKPIAAYYTLEEASQILARLSIKSSTTTIFDPACGSGTLLASSYQQKRKLFEDSQGSFEKETHRRFVEEDITGVDIMPFAAHLSTIHLAMQGPIYDTDKVRIAVQDSTGLGPGSEIRPITLVLPRAQRQRRIEDFRVGPRLEKVATGVVSSTGKAPPPLKLKTVDLVIMNPPFTRQQRLAEVDETYKADLLERFSAYRRFIDLRMPYCAYFVFLADKFLVRGGRIAAVLPATILRGDSTAPLRQFLSKNYAIEYIIAREDLMNFSEDTDFREILLIMQKCKQENPLIYVLIRALHGELGSRIAEEVDAVPEGCEKDFAEFLVRKVALRDINYDNLFTPISVSDSRLLHLWERLHQPAFFVRLGDLATDIQSKDEAERGGPVFGKFVLNASDAIELGRDYWQVRKAAAKRVLAKNLKTSDEMEIPRDCVAPCFRRIPYRGRIDHTNLEEYVVLKNFGRSKLFLQLSEIDSVDWLSWRQYLGTRTSNFAIADRFDITAPGTCLFAYYSAVARVWARIPAAVTGLNDTAAKILSLWFNSTFGVIELLIEQMPHRGGYMQLHKFIFDDILVPNPQGLDSQALKNLLEIFEEVKDTQFPSIMSQFAQLTRRGQVDSLIMNRLKNAFGNDVGNLLNQGFEARRKIDRAVLDAIGWSKADAESLLDWLYPVMLKEILVLKEIMVGRAKEEQEREDQA